MVLHKRAIKQRLALQFEQLLLNFKPQLTRQSPLMALTNGVILSAVDDLLSAYEIENRDSSIDI